MTGSITRLLALAALCIPTAFGQAPPLVIGAAVPQSGVLAELGDGYRKGLLLWADEINAAGGLLGRRVELRLRDDGSDAVKSGPLYRQLIKEDRADGLIGPFGSAAVLMAAAETESARRVMVNGAGASRAIHKRQPRYVFQAGIPYASYGNGVLELAKENGYRKLFLIARDDPVAVEMATAARDAAMTMGLEPGEVQVHAAGLVDYAVQIARARTSNADAWIAFGEVVDAAEMIKSFKHAGYAPKLFFARGAAEPKLISLVGQDAELVLGALAYAPRFPTPGNASFVKAYAGKWSSEPSPAAAAAYAAATVLGEAFRKAGSTEQDKLRAVLAEAAIPTVLGEYKVDPKTGEQIAAAPVLTQLQKGRTALVWPRALEQADAMLPYPQWSERRLLK